jgi:plastocyanin
MATGMKAGICVLILVGWATAACQPGGEAPAKQGQPAAGATPAPAAATDRADGPGVIAGSITFQGTAPTPRPLTTDSDPLCKPEPGATSEVLLVGPGNGLQNVFVYVKDGLGTRTYPVPQEPVVLDQKGCRYSPHVLGIQVGQTLRVTNSDPALHNVNSTPKANRGFNFGQPAGVPPATRVFTTPEIGVPFRCDVHPWMNAYAGVVAHPFFAITAADGTFEIKGLPAGTFTVEAWHEQLGTQTQTATPDGKTPAKLDFTFKPTT